MLDEKPSGHGVLASLLHLATLSLIQIDLKDNSVALQRRRESRVAENESLTTLVNDNVKVTTHIARLFNVLLPELPLDKSVTLATITPTLQKNLPQIYTDMGTELVNYVYDGPQTHRWPKWRSAFILGGITVLLFLILAQFQRFRVTFFPPFGFDIGTILFVFFGTTIASQFLRIFFGRPVTSVKEAGKKESQRWRGFQAYLKDIQTYGDLPEAQAVLDRYFAYAVALDVDQRLVSQVQALGGVMPAWIGSGQIEKGSKWQNRPLNGRPWYYRPWYRRGAWLPRAQHVRSPTRPSAPQSANDQRPPLQRISDQLSGSVAAANQNLTTMLNNATGDGEAVKVEIKAQGQKIKMEWEPGTPVDKMAGEIMGKSQTIRPPRPATSSGSGRGGFRGGGGGFSWWFKRRP